MIFREGAIPKTPGQLRDELGVAVLNCCTRRFPSSILDGKPYWDFDGVFYSLRRGIENLRGRFGDAKTDQLLDMLTQAKAHHEEGWRLTRGATPPAKPNWWENTNAAVEMPGWWQRRIANSLLQDMQAVVMNRQPWAYPKDLYRWHVSPWLPDLSEADLLSKGDEKV